MSIEEQIKAVFELMMPEPVLHEFFYYFGIVPARYTHPEWELQHTRRRTEAHGPLPATDPNAADGGGSARAAHPQGGGVPRSKRMMHRNTGLPQIGRKEVRA